MGSMNILPPASRIDEWVTPPELVARLNRIYQFTLDPCADSTNAKAPKYFTEFDDGLTKPWSDERVFMNPPYSKAAAWCAKAWQETTYGTCPLVVALLPVRTDASWWHDYVLPYATSVQYFRGRIKFQLPEALAGVRKISSPQFASCVVIWTEELKRK
jgi:site-specific DNA-methyltransferase (adenine-specific)